MKIAMKPYLHELAEQLELTEANDLIFPDCKINIEKIKVLMISEAPPADEKDYFYSNAPQPDFMKTTIPLFKDGGVLVENIEDILAKGIYITTAVKLPKEGYEVNKNQLKEHLPILEAEISMFPNLEVIMLMGDVAKKAFNMICKEKTGRNAIPTGSTYKIRKCAHYYNDSIRLFPSYIMTGGNILIEKSKRLMISEDIKMMMELISKN